MLFISDFFCIFVLINKFYVMDIGYACINMSMGTSVTTNRSMIKRTFNARGLNYVSELALLNSKDIIKILQWNLKNGIKFYSIFIR